MRLRFFYPPPTERLFVLTIEQLPTRTAAPVVLLPKNRGLAGQIESIEGRRSGWSGVRYAVRGEDVPFLANDIAKSGRPVLAFTGDDLLDEWLLEGNRLDERIVRRRIAWCDPAAVYGAPALCLIGAGPRLLSEGRALRVAYCARYRRLVERYLDSLRATGVDLEAVPIAGAVEACIGSGVTELVADIVVTGSTIQQAGLRVLRVISTSDVAVLEYAP